MSDGEPAQGELLQAPPRFAAVDLGSNSFHLLIGELHGNEVRPLQKFREKVRLAAGLDQDAYLHEAAQQRGLQCLRMFAQRLHGMPQDSVAVRATNTLRVAVNADSFIARAEAVLGYPIEVISGVEEARLIYLGVAHTLADDDHGRLVVDIGGGSTELIVGERFEPLVLESLSIGAVSYSERFFPAGKLTRKGFERAVLSASSELAPVQEALQEYPWIDVVGSSGTVRAVQRVLIQNGWSTDSVTLEGLHALRDQLLGFERIEKLNVRGLSNARAGIFPAGVAILSAVFETLGLTQMRYSEGALREGILWDLIGRSAHEDVRRRTIDGLMRRFHVDRMQARRVESTALTLFDQIAPGWALDGGRPRRWLAWAADLHEIGLSISHSQYHRHGAYIVGRADLLGFTRQTQSALAILIQGHRRRFPRAEEFEVLKGDATVVRRLTVLLRLAVLLHHTRGAHPVPAVLARADAERLLVQFPEGWLLAHPLTAADLEREAEVLESAGLALSISG
ncbi:MAG: exopolyphosphatase [Pseudomonadota bacterium]|nr:exopolyphosphatase [Pseudomonadota bacterium]